MEVERKKIKLIVINESALTFDADDYMRLRTEYRIIGKLMGCAVPYPRNVTISGLPALFNDFQTKFMIDNGIAELESAKTINESSEATKEAYNSHLNKVKSDGERSYIDARLNAMRDKMDTIIEGKRAKLLKKGVKQDEIQITPDKILSEEEKRLKSTLSTALTLMVQVPTQYPFLKPDSRTIGDFPVANKTKYKVFCDLWQKGYYITNGESFGGDFLTYNDDPMYYHASQIVHVIDGRQRFELYFPVSCTRLAVSVKKKCVFAYIDDTKGKVTYQTILWDNPKLKELYCSEKVKSN